MRISLLVFVILCIHIVFCKHQYYLDGDMECVCMNRLNRRMSVQMKITDTSCKHTGWINRHRPVDCKEAYDNGYRSNGVYRIYPKGYIHGFKVYCDMTTDGGGWTVFQKRFDGGVDFYRSWNEYHYGFGDIYDEYWLGNEKIHKLTTLSNQILRVDMMDDSGTWKYATYKDFSISSSKNAYKISIGTYQGNAGDSLTYHNGHRFQTKDKPGNNNCPKQFTGAWWYVNCHLSNLNGKYGDNNFGKGMNWKTWRGYENSLKRTEMKIRRKQ